MNDAFPSDVRQAFQDFLQRMGLKAEELTLGEKLLFSIAFAKGKEAGARGNVGTHPAAARADH